MVQGEIEPYRRALELRLLDGNGPDALLSQEDVAHRRSVFVLSVLLLALSLGGLFSLVSAQTRFRKRALQLSGLFLFSPVVS
jgi:hypothetical protein